MIRRSDGEPLLVSGPNQIVAGDDWGMRYPEVDNAGNIGHYDVEVRSVPQVVRPPSASVTRDQAKPPEQAVVTVNHLLGKYIPPAERVRRQVGTGESDDPLYGRIH